jgi:hypothetical protein
MSLKKKQKKEKNREKDKNNKKSAWEKGKLIEENHNNQPYSSEYTLELGTRLYNILTDIKSKSESYDNPETKNDYVLLRFRMYRKKIQDYILHFNPGEPKTEKYEILKYLLEVYWDNPDQMYNEISKL